MDYTKLGRRIRQAREEANLSQDVVAQHLGLTSSTISLIESGKRKVDSLELRSFSQLVSKNVAFFLDGEMAIARVTPLDNVDMAFEAYSLGHISLGKLAELLDVPIEEAKAQLEKRNIPINLGVSSEAQLLRDIKNA